MQHFSESTKLAWLNMAAAGHAALEHQKNQILQVECVVKTHAELETKKVVYIDYTMKVFLD